MSRSSSEEESDLEVVEEEFITPPSNPSQPDAVQQQEPASYPYYRPEKTDRFCCSRLSWIFFASVAAAVAGSSTQFGYNSGVINSPQKVIKESFDGFSSNEMNVAVAIFAAGGLIGAVPASIMADLLGRKYTLLLNNVLVWIGVGLQSLAQNPAMFIVGRLIMGINSGINTVLVPLYITEIAPVRLRGATGTLHQLAITGSLLLSQVLGIRMFLGRQDKDFHAWRILFAVPLLFSAFQLAVLPWCPRSPRFLFLKRKDQEKALKALKRLRGVDADINAEMYEMQVEFAEQRQGMGCFQFFTTAYLRKALFVSIILHLAQQLSGISGIVYYSTAVFRLAGVSDPDIATVAVGFVLVAVTLLTVFVIEVVGRRSLMLYGLGGMAVFFLLLTSMFCFQEGFYNSSASNSATAPGVLLVLSSVGIIAFFALGPGNIPWLMVSELFLQEARPIAVGIATAVNWLANFTVGITFPYILNHLYPYGTVLFVATCGVFWLLLYLHLPETRGKSVEEVTEELRNRTRTVNY